MTKIIDIDDVIAYHEQFCVTVDRIAARVPDGDIDMSHGRHYAPRIRPDLGRHTRANLVTPITIHDLIGRAA